MKTLLTLDYELFFGQKTGTPKACLIDATERLLEELNKFDARAVFFVDAAYLVRLRYFAQTKEKASEDYSAVIRQIRNLETQGHQIQLHIHPHWYDTTYDGDNWKIDTRRYRLGDWSREEVGKIITDCTGELNRHLRNKVFAFRAGGWCVQPWQHISRFMKANGITMDCTVYNGGQCLNGPHLFDFSSAPSMGIWKFESEPCRLIRDGSFTELPISSVRVSPLFFWRFALNRLFGDLSVHRTFGDGGAMKSKRSELIRKMVRASNIPVSIDGFKSSLLSENYRRALENGKTHFVAMGHPKALSEFSLGNLRSWLTDVYSRGEKLELLDSPVLTVQREKEVIA
ncbi:hypothetical protein AUP74_01784 [Microbulbifer aggregans]|uniref:Polysaccharide deacetylase n=1 Tax=Microbulbifer aggregans TaxID=1769779 RepID=A0A1C9W7W5_9GAMM|nr:hypothetical protein [Microbulbifer aggregans]AOS97215.1 hypothetical protein AUP74_01784 [Microbulbifer aggregans]